MPYTHRQLGQLAQRAAAGDRTAFDALYAATARFQYYRILHLVASPQVAEDLLQQTDLHLWQKIDTVDPPELVAAYLSGISRNLCLQYLRRQRQTPADLSLDDSAAGDLADTAPTPQQMIDRKSDRERLRTALAALPPDEREAVLLRYGQRLKIRDIAIVMARSESTVKRLLKRALGKLRSQMGLGGLLVWPLGPRIAQIAEQSWRQRLAADSGSGRPHCRRPLRLLTAVSAICALLLLGAATAAPVAIVDARWPQTAPQAQPVTLQAQVVCPAGVREVYLQGEEDRWPLEYRGGAYAVSVPRSGAYTLVARGKNGSVARRRLVVSCIDDQPPSLQHSTVEGGCTVFTFADPSGVAEMYCVDAAGTRIDPLLKDLAAGRFVFALPPGSYTTCVRDALGNTGSGCTQVNEK